MPRAIGYVRVSTEQQAESGLGLQAQEAAVTAAASRLGLELARVFVDAGTSGGLGIEDRPVLLDAVGALKRGDVLLEAKRDRLGGDVIAVAMIERLIAKRGARVISAAEGTDSDDPAALLMRRLIDSFAEYERALIAARTRAALAAKRKRAERISGRVPYGFRLGTNARSLEPEEGEQSTLGLIRALRASGMPLRGIADDLNARGITTRSGATWRFEYVRALLKRAA
jgi:DNA invertase Pin-like site-specific DNA recombinase